MVPLLLEFSDVNAFGACFKGNLTGFALILNAIVTIMMIIQTIATIFSGYEYLKEGKDLLKD